MTTNKGIASAVSGVVAMGAIVGTAAYMMRDHNHASPQMKKMKKSAERAMKNAGIIIENVSDMLK